MIFHLFIATPEEVLYDGDAKDLKAPGTAGSFEVLSNHAPLISTLKTGLLEFTDASDQKHQHSITGGILEVDHNKVSLLLDAIS